MHYLHTWLSIGLPLLVASKFSAHHHALHKNDEGLVHPGALHSASDIERVKTHVKNKDEPWYRAYQHLENGTYAQVTWKASPKDILVRGKPDPSLNLTENYASAYRDAHSAYQLALRWLITDNATFADAAIKTLDAWSATLTDITGSSDK